MAENEDADRVEARPLTTLRAGESARVLRIACRDPRRLVRLSGFGIVPGAVVRLRQKRPAAVIQIAETSVALDPDIASEIWVKRIDGPGRA